MLIIKEKIPVGASKVDDFGDHGAHIGEDRKEEIAQTYYACYLNYHTTQDFTYDLYNGTFEVFKKKCNLSNMSPLIEF